MTHLAQKNTPACISTQDIDGPSAARSGRDKLPVLCRSLCASDLGLESHFPDSGFGIRGWEGPILRFGIRDSGFGIEIRDSGFACESKTGRKQQPQLFCFGAFHRKSNHVFWLVYLDAFFLASRKQVGNPTILRLLRVRNMDFERGIRCIVCLQAAWNRSGWIRLDCRSVNLIPFPVP